MGDLTQYVEAAHRMVADLLSVADFLIEPEWLAVILAALALVPQLVTLGR